jgi:hypothetical protein
MAEISAKQLMQPVGEFLAESKRGLCAYSARPYLSYCIPTAYLEKEAFTRQLVQDFN